MRRQRNPTINPEAATALWCESSPARRTTVTAKCHLITPMYGGGVEPGKVDCAMPIRASALRGQLRFWWRLLFSGGRKATDVFQDECALWGGISAEGPQASQVTVRVDSEPVNDDSQLIDAQPPHVPNYGLIPDRNEPLLLAQGYKFQVTLELQHDEKKRQVVEALRWWASFGGVGARTRRGFGAVEVDCAGVEPVRPNEIQGSGGRVVVGGAHHDALAAWRSALEPLRRFRQGPGIGRDFGRGNRPGRSYWPEADTIRRVAGGKPAHKPQHPADGVYPRAAFGLPIVFHFKDPGDPRDHTLETAGQGDRMASPLILRPYFDGTAYRSMALLLPGWEQRIGVPVVLKRKARATGTPTAAWPDGGDERKRVASQIKPMRGRGEDVLSAFMRYFEEQQPTPKDGSVGGSR